MNIQSYDLKMTPQSEDQHNSKETCELCHISVKGRDKVVTTVTTSFPNFYEKFSQAEIPLISSDPEQSSIITKNTREVFVGE